MTLLFIRACWKLVRNLMLAVLVTIGLLLLAFKFQEYMWILGVVCIVLAIIAILVFIVCTMADMYDEDKRNAAILLNTRLRQKEQENDLL
jgi:nitrogen fixation-related uncharacterized protein